MENRRTSFNKSSGGRRQFNQKRGPNASNDSRDRPSSGGKKRFFKKKSSASDSKMPPPRPGSRPKTKKPWENIQRIKITSELQIIDGRHHGKLLENVEKINSAVSSQKIRETIFRLMARKIRAGRFLDLCAGNGTIGIEALSRGAMLGTFVERSARMCSCIKKNLELCEVKEGHFEIFAMEAVPFLRRMGRRRRFWDIVYCGTPCDGEFGAFLKCFGNGYSIRPGGMLILEHPSTMFFPEEAGLLKRWRVVVKDDISLTIYERK
ncbi:MAG TPA: RsmD family RNA methyltransferase [Pyrinomonadaceae bacterium]|nr:RsmD family RNA methyltransferase [Pyrinomonadaceae bacterium]